MALLSRYRFSVFAAILLLTACGGGGGDSGASGAAAAPSTGTGTGSPSASVSTGVLVDSPVTNIHYKTPTHQGSTNAKGEFSYAPGETVAFSIGDIGIGEGPAKGVMTLLDLTGASTIDDTATINIARLLQSLDEDGDATNGISLSDQAHLAGTGMGLNFSSGSFDLDVVNLVANGGGQGVLVSAEDAKAHLQSQLDQLDQTRASAFHPADFSGYVYDVGWENGQPMMITFLFNPADHSLTANNGIDSGRATYDFEANNKVITMHWSDQPSRSQYLVFGNYDSTTQSYCVNWIDDDSIQTLDAALSASAAQDCSDGEHLTPNRAQVRALQTQLQQPVHTPTSAFNPEDFSGLVYDVYRDNSQLTTMTLTFDPRTHTIAASDGTSSGTATAYTFESDNKVIAMQWADQPNHWQYLVFDSYDTATQSYCALWVDDDAIQTVAAALQQAASMTCNDHLTPIQNQVGPIRQTL